MQIIAFEKIFYSFWVYKDFVFHSPEIIGTGIYRFGCFLSWYKTYINTYYLLPIYGYTKRAENREYALCVPPDVLVQKT